MGGTSGEGHASTKLYWGIAIVLCVITYLEWVIFKFENIRTNASIMIPALIAMSIAKFVLVAGWYMHLRYDHKWLGQIFVFSMFLAMFIMGIYMVAI